MIHATHPDNRGRDQLLGQDETQGHLRQSHARRYDFLECAYPFQRGRQILRTEIPASPVIVRKASLGSQISGQASFVERDASDDADVQFSASRKQLVFWSLVKNVIDDLNRVYASGSNGLDAVGGLPAVETQPEIVN